MAKGVCFYCLDDKISVSICLNCRSSFERAKDEIKRLRREIAILRQEHWKRMNAKKKAVKSSMRARP